MSDSLRPHGLQHSRLPCPSPIPTAYSNSGPSSQWCHTNHLILCHPLLPLPSIFSSIRVFSNESVLHIRWPKYWSFSFSISSSNEYSGLISFRMDIINEHNQSDFCFDHLVMSMGSIVSSAFGNGCLPWPACSLDKIVICCPVSSCIPRPNLPVILYICWLPNCAFQSPMMKRTFFLCSRRSYRSS